jgi:hypothetical protein
MKNLLTEKVTGVLKKHAVGGAFVMTDELEKDLRSLIFEQAPAKDSSELAAEISVELLRKLGIHKPEDELTWQERLYPLMAQQIRMGRPDVAAEEDDLRSVENALYPSLRTKPSEDK